MSTVQEQKKKRKLKKKHKLRRHKDCMIGLPFIVAFQGDPAQSFFCNDVVDYETKVHNYELIYSHCSNAYFREKPLTKLLRYMSHHVMSIQGKILIYKAGI